MQMWIHMTHSDHYMEQAVLHVDSMSEPGHSAVCTELNKLHVIAGHSF